MSEWFILRTLTTLATAVAAIAPLPPATTASAQEPVPFRTLEADTVRVGYPVYRSADHGLRLRQVTESAGLTPGIDTGGASVFDADGDGDLDVFLHAERRTYGTAPSRLHLNDGRGRFRAALDFPDSLYLEAAIPADLDGDGHVDLVGLEDAVWGGMVAAVPVVLLNDGELRFRRVSLPLDDTDDWTPFSLALGDVDRDGHHDLGLVEVATEGSHCRLVHWQGLGDGRFELVQIVDLHFRPAPWQKSNAPRWDRGSLLFWDDDRDGDLDAHVLNSAGYWSGQPETLIHRNVDGRFAEEAERQEQLFPAHESQALLLADFDRDLRLDVFHGVSDYRGGRNQLLLSQNDGSLRPRGSASGLWAGYTYTTACAAGDLDADGWVDLVQSRHRSEGRPTSPAIYRNVDGQRFEFCERLLPRGLEMVSLAAVLFDADGDLDLDLLLTAGNQQLELASDADLVDRLFLQEAETGASIAFRLQGTNSPRDARDSRIEIRTATGWQLRVVGQGGVTGASNPPLVQHFGLGQAEEATQVRVRWTSGRVEEFGPRPAGVLHTLVEGEGSSGVR